MFVRAALSIFSDLSRIIASIELGSNEEVTLLIESDLVFWAISVSSAND